MKNKKVRILSAFLASLMLVGAFASCAKSGDDDAADTQGADSVTEAETQLSDNLPSDLNYGGDTVTIISRDLEGWTRGEVSVEKLNGDPVNDSIYERNKAVESRLNVKIESILDNDSGSGVVPEKVVTAVKAGTSEYDLMAACSYTTFPHTLTGSFVNLKNVDYLDLEQPWWTQGFNEAVAYNDMQFMATGSVLLSIYRFAFVTVFNKDMFTDANQPFLYDTVEAGQWTLDKQTALVPLFYQDDGDGVQEAEGDIYGFISSKLISTDAYWSSCELDIIKKNADGVLEVVMDTDKIHSATDKILKLYYGTDNGTYALDSYGGDAEQDDIRDMFSQGQGAMATLRIMALENQAMRKMEQEYGVVPMPKYDEAQKDYKTLLHDQFTVYAVPTTVQGPKQEMVGAVLEAMGSASYNIVKPAYYEQTLRTKIAADPQSALMMDIITEGIYIDLGIIYVDCGVHAGLRSMVGENSNNTSSRFKRIIKTTENKLKQMNKKMEKLAAAGS